MSSLGLLAKGSRLITDTSKYITSTSNSYSDDHVNDHGLIEGLNNLSSFISYCSDNIVKITPLWTKDYKDFHPNQYAAYLQTVGFYNSGGNLFQKFKLFGDTKISLNLDHYSEQFSGVKCYVTKINGNPVSSNQSINITDSSSGVFIGTLDYELNSNTISFTPSFDKLNRDKYCDTITIEIAGFNDFDPSLPLIITSLDFYLGYKNNLCWNDTLYCTDIHNRESLEVNNEKWYFTPHVLLEVTSENLKSLDLKDTLEILYSVCPSTMVINRVYYNGNLVDISSLYKKSIEFEKWIISKSILGGSSPINDGDSLSTILY